MEFMVFLELLAVTLKFISSLIIFINDVNRTREMKEIGEQIGLTFYRIGKTSQLNNLLHFQLFSLDLGSFKQMKSLLYTKTEELNTAIFDYHFEINRYADITVIYFRSPLLNLPNFNLLRKPHFTDNTFGERDVIFPSNPIFSDKYYLFTDDEEAVRGIFNERLLAYFEQKRTLNLEGAKDRLILYYSDGIVEAERIEFFLEEGYRVLKLFKESQPQKNESTKQSLIDLQKMSSKVLK